MIGTVLDGRYDLIRIVGEGGMGAVYEAMHLGTGRRLAIKVISKKENVYDDEIVMRFQREARAAGSIMTPHIVQVLDAGRDRESDLPFIAMEFLVGHDLSEIDSRLAPLPPDLALRIAAQACAGLQKAHEASIIHRDIKPANLFVSQQVNGEVIVKLLDFGIAKLPPELDAGGGTITGRLLGSPLFMSPEQAQGLKTLDHRTDIWSLGAVLYEMLTGQSPFAEYSTLGQLILAICSRPPPDIAQIAPWVPTDAIRIVQRALAIDLDERYPAAGAMLSDLLSVLGGGFQITSDMVLSRTGDQLPATPPTAGPRRPSNSAFAAAGATLKSREKPEERSEPPSPPADVALARPKASSERTIHSAAHSALPALPAPSVVAAQGQVSRVPLVALLVVGILGLAVLWQVAKGAGLLAAGAPLAMSEAVRPVEAALAAPSVANTSAPSIASDTALRHVEVAISPANARVEVDGRPVDAAQGKVSIAGALGSVHRVRLSHEQRETSADVVISDPGPVPPRIDLEPPPKPISAKPKGIVAAAAPTASASAGLPPPPAARAASSNPASFSTLQKTFE